MATGTTDGSGNVTFSNVPAGVHSVQVSAPGFQPFSGTISVTGNATFTVTLMATVTGYAIVIHVQNEQGAAQSGVSVTMT